PTNPMHVGATLLFGPGATLSDEESGVDIERVRVFIGNRLQYVPRYRQRLRWVPVERHPVWVDDEHFDLTYHVRHVALPKPGTREQLREIAGRFLSERLDRSRPLWEVLVVEGLADGGFGLVTKVHHCMIDGIGGVDLLKVILAPFPSDDVGEPDVYEPRPAPEQIDLFLEEAVRRLQLPATAIRNFRKFREETREIGEEVRHRFRAMSHTALSGWFVNASDTPLNRKIGPNRRIAHLVTDLERVKAVKNGLGGTVNDVVIATVAGAVRSFLVEDRGFDIDGVDFRAMVPVSIRDDEEPGVLGNHITMWLVDLPIDEADPVARLKAVGERTRHLKETDQALGAALLTQSASFTPSTVLTMAARVVAATARPFNMTITNVPGPQVPLYLLDSQLLRIFPMVPLWVNHGLGVALFSYDGSLDWGFCSDWETVPDLDAFVLRVEEALDELHAAATKA
ncbi:MAG: wax ester/triacylglycerol synthase family O-acyltransferase, partial [Acidimicrobiia bacterium]|nr:wax ester/triacylglycerol synthase family O-acyltransferase [Acidimicrobiia bacterium]